MPLTNRDATADFIKSTAIFLVIVVNASSASFHSLPTTEPATWLTVVFYNTLGHVSIPLFVMVSGALLLDLSKEESSRVFLKKRFVRIAPSFFFWTAIYFAWRAFANQETLTPVVILQDTLSGAYHHFWFIYMIISLYLITPILRVFVRHAQRKLVYYASALAILCSAILPILNSLGYGINQEFFLPSGFVGLYLLGYLLKTKRFSVWNLLVVFLGGVILTVIGYYYLAIAAQGQIDVFQAATSTYLPWLSFLGILLSVSAYLLLRMISLKNRLLIRLFTLIGASTLTMYFVHIILLEIFQRGFIGLTINPAVMNPVFEIPLICALVFVISLSIALALAGLCRNFGRLHN